MKSRQTVRRVVLAQAVMAVLAMGGMTGAHAMGQSHAEMVAHKSTDPVRLDIPAQSLRSALDAFAVQTGLQVVYESGSAVKGIRAHAIHDTLMPGEALSKMLAATGLEFGFVNLNTVAIRPDRSAPQAAQDARGNAAAATGNTAATVATMNVAEGTADASDLGEVVVTGTNLRNIDPASPLVIIDAELIRERGFSTIEDVLRHLPQNFSSRTTASAALGEKEYGDTYGAVSGLGNSSVNLRGLGSRSTLVLVNGHRRTGSAQGQGGYTDISSIPISQVERIEVLTDGASAIYGADAVAGVVNIVLKKNYRGTVVQLRHEDSSSGADASRLSIAHTFGWESGYLSASGSFRKEKPADISRFIHTGPAGRGDFTDLGGVNARTPDMGQPGVVYQALDFGIGYHFVGAPLGVVPSGQNGENLRLADLLPYNDDTAPSTYEVGRIGPKTTTPSLRLDGEQRFGKDLKLSYGASYTRQRNQEYWHPQVFDFSFLEDGSTTWVPADNPNNHFGQDVLVGYSYKNEFAGMTLSEEQKQTNTNFNLGLSGNLPGVEGWDFEITYNDSRERGQTDVLGDITGSMGEEGYARTMHVLEGLNVLGDGSDPDVVASNRELLNSLVERYAYSFSSHSRTLDLLTRGNLFSLPAGDAEIAIGAQYRDEDYHFLSTLGGVADSDTSRKVHAAFAELGIPLLKDVPGAKELTLTLAARYEGFDQRGSNEVQNTAYNAGQDLVALGGFDIQALTGAVPGDGAFVTGESTPVKRRYSNTSRQARLAWKPVESLRIRATWGESFLTPLVQQQFGMVYIDDRTFSVGYNGGTLPEGVDYMIALRGPNPNLKPQVATVKTFGFDYTPSFATGLTLSATYNDTRFENYIGDPLTGMSYEAIFSDIRNMPPETFVKGDNNVMLWDSRQINFLGRRSRSIDTNLSYFFGNTLGDWRIELNAVRTLELTAQTLPSQPTVRFSDSEYGPSNWAADVFLGWENGNYFASTGAHYTSAHRIMHPFSATGTIYNDFVPNPDPRYHAGSYTTVDFQAGYRWLADAGWLSGTTLRLGIQNAFNRDFPFVDNRYGFISNRVNVRGRVMYLDLKKEF